MWSLSKKISRAEQGRQLYWLLVNKNRKSGLGVKMWATKSGLTFWATLYVVTGQLPK